MAQPVFDRLSRNPVFFIDEHVGAWTAVLLVLSLSILIPAIVIFIEFVAGCLGRRVRDHVHAFVVWLLLLAFFLPLLARINFLPGSVLAVISLALSLVGVFAYLRFAVVRLTCSVAAPSIVLFPALLLFHSPITSLVFSKPPVQVQASVRNPVPVIMVVFDEFCGVSLMNEQSQIDSIRFPNFAALAQDGTWFRNATSVYPKTDMAVPCILTGNYPHGRYEVTLSEHPVNLFTLLLSTDQYEIAAFEPCSRLFPEGSDEAIAHPTSPFKQTGTLLKYLFPVYLRHESPLDWQQYLPKLPPNWFSVRPSATVRRDQRTGVVRYGWDRDRDEQLTHFLECIVPSDRPRLYFIHAVVPHFPWCYLPSGRKYLNDSGLNDNPYPLGTRREDNDMWGNDELAVTHAYQRYLLQVGFVDHWIGKLVERLKEAELYERSLFIVIADHGVSFRPNQSRRIPTAVTLPDIMSIPLFIKLPHQTEGATSDRNVQSIDVLPTLMDILGADPPLRADGRSLFGGTQPEPAQKVFYTIAGPVTVDPSFDSKNTTLENLWGLLGSGEKTDGPSKIGLHNELIGRTVEDLEVTELADVEVRITHGETAFLDDPSELSPGYFEGLIGANRSTKLPVELAIAVNGTIRGVTRTYLEENSKSRWAALVPESSFQVGQNKVQIFVVSSANGRLTLQRTGEP